MNLLLVPLVCVALNPAPFDAKSVYARTQNGVVTVRTDEKVGSGFVIGDGTLIVTCHHVIKEAPTTIKVKGQPAEILAQDPESDIAVLRVAKKAGKPLTISPVEPKPGTKIYVIGNPLGMLEKTISEGIVSAVRKRGNLNLVQITAPISEGSSGGPVVDEKGNVVAMVALTLTTGQALNFAVGTPRIRKSTLSAAAVARKRPFRAPAAAALTAAQRIRKDIRAYGASEILLDKVLRHGQAAIPIILEELKTPKEGDYQGRLLVPLIEFGEAARAPTLKILATGTPLQRRAVVGLYRFIGEASSSASARMVNLEDYVKDRRDAQFKIAQGEEVKAALAKVLRRYDSAVGSDEAALALAYLGHKDQTEALLEATKQANRALVVSAFEALLVTLEPSEIATARQAFDNLFSGSTDEDLGEDEENLRVEEMADALMNTRTEVGVALMIQLLAHDDWEVRYEICDALCERPAVEALPAVKKLLEDEDENVRWAALAATGNLGKGDMVERMAAYAKSSNTTDRWWGVYAAGLSRSHSGLDVVLSRLDDPDAGIRSRVASSLETLLESITDVDGVKKARAALKKLAIDPDADVRATAKEALDRLEEE
ncbi:MAG: trypsin-like peptidase domain-containing protein [Fimbriimonas sp.]